MKNTPLLLLLTLVFSLLFAPITHAAAYIKSDGVDGEVKTNEKTDTSTSSASYKREDANAYELKNVQVVSVVEEKPETTNPTSKYSISDEPAFTPKPESEIGVPPDPKLNPPKPDNKEDDKKAIKAWNEETEAALAKAVDGVQASTQEEETLTERGAQQKVDIREIDDSGNAIPKNEIESSTKVVILNPELTQPTAISVPDSCLLYTSPSPRDRSLSRMPSSA